jgi:putative DNA primase/helicase
MICEGEKKCQPAETLFPDFVAVSTQGGSNAGGKTDFSAIKGRCIVQVRASFPRSWDLADPLPEGWDASGLRPLVDRAVIVAQTSDDHVPVFRMESDGLYYDEHMHEDEEEEGDKPAIRVSGPFKVAAQTRDGDQRNWGVLLQWLDRDGRLHEWAMPSSMLAGDAAELRGRLLDEGLDVPPHRKARELLTSYLGRVTQGLLKAGDEAIPWALAAAVGRLLDLMLPGIDAERIRLG